RKAVDDSLEIVSAQRKSAPDMTILNDELKEAGWTAQDLMRLSKKMPQAVSDYTDSTNLEAAKLVEHIEALFQGATGGIDPAAFIDLAEQAILPGLSFPY